MKAVLKNHFLSTKLAMHGYAFIEMFSPVTGLLPLCNVYQTHFDFKNRTSNVRSLFPKMDINKIWADTTNTDIMVLSKTWLKKFLTDDLVFIGRLYVSCMICIRVILAVSLIPDIELALNFPVYFW